MIFFKFASSIRKLYWRLARPRTFGVKAVIARPGQPNQCLVVQHSYGSKNAWNFPGGGYRPSQETPAAAVQRELREELGVGCRAVSKLGEYWTNAEGKQDTVSIFVCELDSYNFSINRELFKVDWRDLEDLAVSTAYYRVVRHSATLLLNSRTSNNSKS